MTDVPAVDQSLPYRPCVGITLFNKDGYVLVGERLDSPGAWQMPQGGIDDGEDIETAAYREMREEIGTDKAQILRISPDTLRYDLPPHLMGKMWGGAYRGQEQTWVAFLFTGQDDDLNLNAHDPAEFARVQWVPLPQIVDLIVPFKKETYKRVAGLFDDIARSLQARN